VKKLIAALFLCSLATDVPGQGSVTIVNGTYAFARTNDYAFTGSGGNTSPILGGFVYGLFVAPSTVTTIDNDLQDLFGPNWHFTGLYATNTAAPGRLNGGALLLADGWTPDQTNSFLLLGWSTTIAGKDWTSVSNQLRGAKWHSGGVWSGGSFSTNINAGSANMFLGATAIGYGKSGDPDNGLPPFSLFGPNPTPQGYPIHSPFVYVHHCGSGASPAGLCRH